MPCICHSHFPHVVAKKLLLQTHTQTIKHKCSVAFVATQLLEFFLCDLQGLNLCHRFDGSRTRLIAKQGVFTKVIALLQSGHFLPDGKTRSAQTDRVKIGHINSCRHSYSKSSYDMFFVVCCWGIFRPKPFEPHLLRWIHSNIGIAFWNSGMSTLYILALRNCTLNPRIFCSGVILNKHG